MPYYSAVQLLRPYIIRTRLENLCVTIIIKSDPSTLGNTTTKLITTIYIRIGGVWIGLSTP